MQWHSYNCKCPDTVWGHFPVFAFPEPDNDKWMEGSLKHGSRRGLCILSVSVSVALIMFSADSRGNDGLCWWSAAGFMWPAISVTLEINAVLSFDHSYNRNWWECHKHTSHAHAHTTPHRPTHTHTQTQTHTHTNVALQAIHQVIKLKLL